MEVIITEQPEMDSVVTMVELDTQQIKYLIDLMWSTDPTLSNQVAIRHNVDDVKLEKTLNIALGSALDEVGVELENVTDDWYDEEGNLKP
tara:strand:- start:77 stop:346 length:270 start_codon:yes stop_codon:yes gene_type:complete